MRKVNNPSVKSLNLQDKGKKYTRIKKGVALTSLMSYHELLKSGQIVRLALKRVLKGIALHELLIILDFLI
jgi:hypothetical protein